MWFPTDMAVFDFAVEITGFDEADRAHPLVRMIAEILDRLGSDHLLAHLVREGELCFGEVYPSDPIMISGSTSEPYAFETRVRAAARSLLPGVEVRVDWREHDEAAGASAAVNREIERVSRMFRGLARGAVPARVRLAILNPGVYLSQFCEDRDRNSLDRSTELTLTALYSALSDIGAAAGLDWKTCRGEAERAFGNLRVRPVLAGSLAFSDQERAAFDQGGTGFDQEETGADAEFFDRGDRIDQYEGVDYSDYASFVDRWVAADEAELAAGDPADPLHAHVDEYLRSVLAGAVRDALDSAAFERAASPGSGPKVRAALTDPTLISSHSLG